MTTATMITDIGETALAELSERKSVLAKLWYVADIATQLGVDLSHVADMNIRKLADRQKRGVIKSEGDNR
jgi:hypothetical protein